MKVNPRLQLKNKWIRLNSRHRLHQCPIPIIALTGGIASGKSTVGGLFEKKGIQVINADHLIKMIYAQEDSLNFIKREFPHVVEEEQRINFKKLRKEIFSQKEKRLKIESFLYEKIPAEFLKQIPPQAQFVVYDIPLLFEKNLDSLVDLKILVYASASLQRERLIKRDKISPKLAQEMLDSQWSIEDKKSKVDFVIHNLGDQKDLTSPIDKIFQEIFTP